MTTLYWILLSVSYVGFVINIGLCVHFAKRCNWLGFPRAQTDQKSDDATNHATIRRDARRWSVLPVCSFLIVILASVYGDWETSIDRQHTTPALVIVGGYSLVTIFALAILISAYCIRGKHPLIE